MEDTDRRGFYVNANQCTVYITVKSLHDIEVVSVKKPESVKTSNQGEVRYILYYLECAVLCYLPP